MKVSHIGFILGLIGLTGAAPTFANTVSLCDGVSGNLVANCGFEAYNPSNPSVLFPSWTATQASSGSDFSSTTNVLNTGSYDARFGATDGLPDFIDQSLATTAGQTYTVSFYVDTAANGGVNNGQFQADWGGSQILLITNKAGETDSVPYQSIDSAGYELYTFTETASSSSTDLKFGGFAGTSYYHLDDVVVTPNTSSVPEPSSVSFLLAGLIGIALVGKNYLRKRTN